MFSLKMFLGKSSIKCLSKEHYKLFFHLFKIRFPNFTKCLIFLPKYFLCKKCFLNALQNELQKYFQMNTFLKNTLNKDTIKCIENHLKRLSSLIHLKKKKRTSTKNASTPNTTNHTLERVKTVFDGFFCNDSHPRSIM